MGFTKELKEKLIAAKSVGELEELVRSSDAEIGEDELEHLWEEIGRARDKKDRELSIDELEAVGGGFFIGGEERDYLTDGCAGTVEPGSWCGSNDRCYCFDVNYRNRPVRYCSRCGGISYLIHPYGRTTATWSRCINCGFEQWVEDASNLV